MKKSLNNFIVRLISIFIWNKTQRKTFRKKYLINKKTQSYKIKIEGKNNKIIVVKDGKETVLKNGQTVDGINIKIYGQNNTVKLVYPLNIINSSIEIRRADNSYTEINPSSYVDGLRININYGTKQKLIIGEGTTSCGLKIDLPSNASCLIGKDCMFAEFVKCWAGDCHAITDKNTGELINPDPEALVIGDHCWIGDSSRLLKNTILPNNTIVAACSVVTKKFDEENLIIGGSPAKMIRENAVWHRDNQYTGNFINK